MLASLQKAGMIVYKTAAVANVLVCNLWLVGETDNKQIIGDYKLLMACDPNPGGGGGNLQSKVTN